jgi:hypothetical protein
MSLDAKYMTALLAIGLLVAFFILFRLAYASFRRPDPPAWVKIGLVAELVCVGLVSLLAVGITLAIREIGAVVIDGLSLKEGVVIMAALALVVLACKFLPKGLSGAAQMGDLAVSTKAGRRPPR